MKYNIIKATILFLLFSISIKCIGQGQPYITSWNYGNAFQRIAASSSLLIPFQDTTLNTDSLRAGDVVVGLKDSLFYWYTGTHWVSSSSASSKFTGGTITAIPTVGQTINSSSIQDWLNQAFYPTQAPTSTLTMTYGATTAANIQTELVATSTLELPVTLNWNGGRQAKTQPLATIVVAGISQTFSQPSAGSSVSGTQPDSVVRNTTTSFQNIVTTTDGKTATSTTSITFLPKRYWGYNGNSAPTSVEILAAAGGGSELSASKSNTNFTVVVPSSGFNHVFYTYPASEGVLTSIIVGGLESIGAFTQTTTSLTNASGYTQNYYVYTSNNTFTNTTITFNSVN